MKSFCLIFNFLYLQYTGKYKVLRAGKYKVLRFEKKFFKIKIYQLIKLKVKFIF